MGTQRWEDGEVRLRGERARVGTLGKILSGTLKYTASPGRRLCSCCGQDEMALGKLQRFKVVAVEGTMQTIYTPDTHTPTCTERERERERRVRHSRACTV